MERCTDGIDTTSSAGTLGFHIMGALAEFERSLMLNLRAGMQAAQRRGNIWAVLPCSRGSKLTMRGG